MFAVTFPSNRICDKSHKTIVQKSVSNYKSFTRDAAQRDCQKTIVLNDRGVAMISLFPLPLTLLFIGGPRFIFQKTNWIDFS